MSEPKSPRAMRFESRMTQADALMWHLEADPVLRSTILSTWILDRAPDMARFEAKTEQATHIIPRLRQFVVEDPLGIAPPKWAEDTDFDLRFHLRRSRLPGQGTIRDLLDLAEPIAMQAFDKDRPLWELHVIEGLEGGRCAVIMKLHHAISDGVGLVKMTECLIERGPEEEPIVASARGAAPKVESKKPEPTVWENVAEALTDRVRSGTDRWRRMGSAITENAGAAIADPLKTINDIRDTLSSAGRVLAPSSEPLSPIMRGRSTVVRFDYLSIPLDDLKRAGKAAGGTINDAFVAAVAGGLSRYHLALNAPVEKLRMLMPVNIRGGQNPKDPTSHAAQTADVVGNQFAPARFEVPVAIANPTERMAAIGQLCRAQRDEKALPWMEEITNLVGALPTVLAVNLFGAMQKTTDFTTSNVPGPRRPTWMSGARIENFMPFGPIAGASLNVTAFSYDGALHVGINMDPAAVAQPKLLVECLKGGFQEVLAVVE